MNKLKSPALALLFLFPFLSQAQNNVEPYIGYGIDVNNKQPLSQVNIGLQYPVINQRIYQMLIGVNGGLPLNKHTGNDVAYTSDLSLPLSTGTGYETKWYSCAVSLGHRFRLISWADKNIISPFVKAGLAYQNIAVRYDSYNMDKYTVLNPHRSLKKTGLFIAGGIQYKCELNKGYIFAQAEISSPPLVESLNNYTYELPGPFTINIGYVVEFKKRNK
ncbi:hypothetical protein [Agriterribacter sp.]|uniref:hypothetical protein n=1 Tax=Agriterribacter sp. TaxID=2821509 RepID=UPI002BBD8D68|nr:hypothetical protein [Agriterribacter sp.]HRO45636.1 hypothetical protein [Agriterribacter sp.]HRQ17457.1 hypothetical protein [Agriterribacter sp.]